MKETVKLILEIETFGLECSTIPFVYIQDTQMAIDNLTLRYQTENDFFNKNKNKILMKLIGEKNIYSISINPIDISLKKIYISKTNKNLKALFQTNNFYDECHHSHCMIPLEALVKNNLRNGIAFTLYQMDKEALQTSALSLEQKYTSLFANCQKEILEQLELGMIDSHGIETLWLTLKKDPNLFSIIRYLLTKENQRQNLQKIIDLKWENKNQKELNRGRNKLPYKD
ncbi:MAG: hypothetical protein HFI08_03675 [Bacilli bacterium]|nr:hypothetical protein [Bacilli bacterium]